MTYSMPALCAAAALFGLASGSAILAIEPALASENEKCAVPATAVLPDQAIREKLEADGYQVLEIEREDNCLEAEVRNAEGTKIELMLDPASGVIIGKED